MRCRVQSSVGSCDSNRFYILQAMLSMIKVDSVVKILMTILYDAAMPR